MDDLVAFLRARLDEDRAAAQAAVSEHAQEPRLVACDAGGQWVRHYGDYGGTEVVDGAGHVVVSVAHDKGAMLRTHIARHDPARVLREVEAKRRIVDRYAWLREHGDTGDAAWVLPLLAAAFADHPDYRPEWAPAS